MWRTIGFEKQKEMFESLIDKGTLAHAYIFQGPDQIGKKMFAQDAFTLINKRKFFEISDPDLYVLSPKTEEGETKIYIEDIRDLKNFLSLKPYLGPYQVVIIDNAHRLTIEASNSFLKLFEEPSGKAIFILVTSQPQELLPTISSRAQHVSFPAHSEEVISKVLERTKLSKPDQELIKNIAQGRIGWAIEATQGARIKEVKQAVEDFTGILGSPLAERMLYAKNMFEKQPYQDQVRYWLAWAYANRNDLPNASHILSQLLNLHEYIQQPQYNHRALLENTLINL